MNVFSRLTFTAALLALAATASAATRVVDDDGEATASNCNSPNDTPYTTVSAALDDAVAGDKIIVCSGIYDEQLVITVRVTITGKIDTLGLSPVAPTIRPTTVAANTTSLSSGAPVAAIVLLDGADANLSIIDSLTIDGGANDIAGCAPVLMGVYFRNASGTIKNSAVKDVRLGAGEEGCQSGLGIYVQSLDPGVATVTVDNNSVHDSQKNGITANGDNTTATIKNNSVTGWGPTPSIAQNGIQVGFGATGLVDGNVVNNHVYSLCVSVESCGAASLGILVFDAGDGVTVSGNVIGSSQGGIYLGGSVGLVKSNTIVDSQVWDGVYVDGDTNTITANTIVDSDESGVWVAEGTTGNQVTKNRINETPYGVVIDPITPALTSGTTKNLFYNVNKMVVLPVDATALGVAAVGGRPTSAVE